MCRYSEKKLQIGQANLRIAKNSQNKFENCKKFLQISFAKNSEICSGEICNSGFSDIKIIIVFHKSFQLKTP